MASADSPQRGKLIARCKVPILPAAHERFVAVRNCRHTAAFLGCDSDIVFGSAHQRRLHRAGLDKLSPQELNRLNAPVKQQRDEAVRLRAVQSSHTGRNGDTAGRQNDSRVRLTPGTQIDYETVETQLVEPFRGYVPGDVLTLANGQRWKVVEGRYWAPAKAAHARKVSIRPGMLGGFFLEIEDGGRAKVRFIGAQN